MGETSAKSMRGSGMEDVIFSGTSNKPSKNIAEVSVTLENKENEKVFSQNSQDENSNLQRSLYEKIKNKAIKAYKDFKKDVVRTISPIELNRITKNFKLNFILACSLFIKYNKIYE